MKKRIIVNIYTRIVIGGIVLFSLALLACPELPKGSTSPSPYPFSLAKVLYDAVQSKKVPAYNDDKSKAAGIIFRGLGATAGDTLSVIHVDDTGDDVNDGSAWTKAKRTIKDALDDITDASANNLYLVLIGSGTYKITETLTMQNYVAIIGGFNASSDEESGYESNTATVISGGDSVLVFENKELDTPTKSTAVLAGVTITNGQSTDGGGMYNEKSSPTITHTTFSENTSQGNGGGMYNSESSPTITHTTFSENTSTSYGGGMYNIDSSPTITYTTFSKNTVSDGGGGMYNEESSSPTISSSIFWGNTTDNIGNTSNQIENDDSNPVVAHSIVQGGYADGTAIIDQDPLLDTLKDNGGFVKTIAIKTGSPAINMGLYVARTDTTYYYSENGTDWFTDPKLTKGKTSNLPADATPYTTDARGYTYNGRPDMGAYEYGGTAP